MDESDELEPGMIPSPNEPSAVAPTVVAAFTDGVLRVGKLTV
jgi:hypothetical protein